jgi:hypothetical protein
MASRLPVSHALTTPAEGEAISIAEAAQVLGVHRNTIRNHAVRLGLGRRTAGTRRAFTTAEVEQLRQALVGEVGRRSGLTRP